MGHYFPRGPFEKSAASLRRKLKAMPADEPKPRRTVPKAWFVPPHYPPLALRPEDGEGLWDVCPAGSVASLRLDDGRVMVGTVVSDGREGGAFVMHRWGTPRPTRFDPRRVVGAGVISTSYTWTMMRAVAAAQGRDGFALRLEPSK